MSTFLTTLIVILAVVVLMAIGVIFGRRPIAGSCGGLARLGLECDCDQPCPKKLARMQAEAQRSAEAEAARADGQSERGTGE